MELSIANMLRLCCKCMQIPLSTWVGYLLRVVQVSFRPIWFSGPAVFLQAGTIVEKAMRRQIRRGITPLPPPSTMIQKASVMPQQTELTSSKKPDAAGKVKSAVSRPAAGQNHEEKAEHVAAFGGKADADGGKADAAAGARDGSDVPEKLKDSPGGLHAIREEDKPVAANPIA